MRRFEYAPTRTSEKTVEDIVAHIGQYYSLPLAVRFDEETSTAYIDAVQHLIVLPTWIVKAQVPKIYFLVAHEQLHPQILPRSIHEKMYLEALARERGIENPELFLNLVADQLVNNEGLTEPPFKDQFAKGCASFYRASFAKAKKQGFDIALWHAGNCLRRTLEVQGRRYPAFGNQTEEKLFKLAFHDERPFEHRYLEIIELVKPWFRREEGRMPWLCNMGESSFPPITNPKEFEEWTKKIGKLDPKAVLASLKKGGDRRVLFDYCELKSFEAYIVAQMNAEKKAAQKSGLGESLGIWHPTDRATELDMQKTLSSYGVFLPSLTAVKRTEGCEALEETRGKGLQCFILDQSGSMFGSIDLVAIIAWAAVRCARARGDEIAMLSFSDPDKPRFLLEPTTAYDSARQILEEIQAEGSTHLSPCLQWLTEYSREKRLKPTVIIFTDTAIYDEEQSLQQLRRIKELGGLTIIVSTTSQEFPWVTQAEAEFSTKCFRVNYENLNNIDEILAQVMER